MLMLMVCANCLLAADAPPAEVPCNNDWSGFPVGSWIEASYYNRGDPEYKAKDREETLRMYLTDIGADGGVTMNTFSKADKKWVRHLYRSGTQTGAVVNLNGWRNYGDREHIIYDGKSVKKYVDDIQWKEEKLPDEVLEIGGKRVQCQVREWKSTEGEHQKLRFWFGKDVKLPMHMDRFGGHVLTLCVDPQVVKIVWYAKDDDASPSSTSRLVSFAEPLTVAGKERQFPVWVSDLQFGQSRAENKIWLSDELPGRRMKNEIRRKDDGTLLQSTTVQSFHVQAKPRTPADVGLKATGWTGFQVGTRVTYSLTQKPAGDKPADKPRVWTVTYLGVCDDGYPILQTKQVEGPSAGIETMVLEMPWPELIEINASLKTSKEGVQKIAAAEFPTILNIYDMKDEWDRPWQAALLLAKEPLKLPRRDFSCWFVESTLSENTLGASALVDGQSLARKVVAIDEEIAIAGQTVKCVKEEEALKSPTRERHAVYWHSLQIPGSLVKSVVETKGKSDSGTTTKEVTSIELGK
ncbi:MAG: hypothetical protein M5U26_23040 [Planctomycetota bacterium]|nr:hypothetical protein [Planctomycetota bacterium]